MDAEILYSIVGIVGFVAVIVLTLRSSNTKVKAKTKKQKKVEIIAEYKGKLVSALESLGNDKALRISKKTALIKEYSDELSRNIFFDANEVREIVLELSIS
ncbi:MAG: hypothetical protein ACI9TV_001297 [Sulfurimonas sp.]|jgi:hypothetical protein|uniref:hypothetical protein n=1 Tax=Sulfurimonas sp. TaxID=2022749 RepID=UPI0039E3D588